MDNRFTFKDFVFMVMFVGVIGAVVLAGLMFHYQELRLNDVKQQVQRVGDNQNQQLEVLSDIRNVLRNGVRVNGGTAGTQASAGTESSGRIRQKNADGSVYVYYPDPPGPTRDPRLQPDFATGDWLVQNMDSEPKVIEPYIEKDEMGAKAQDPVLEGLLQENFETFELEPLLAESYWASGDGLTFRFKLRQNICFSDGQPVTVEDVIFSYNTLMNPAVDAAPERSYMGHVKSCTKVDDRTVEFKMDEPYYATLFIVGAGLHIIPEHVYKFSNADEYNRNGSTLVGTGPYRVERWDKGQQLVMARNERYWNGRPTFDRLVFKFISNEQAAFQAFQDGQIDQFEPTGEQYAKFSSDPDFIKKFTAYKFLRVNSGYAFIGYNLKRPMFKDKETRRALGMLLDRKTMIHTLLYDMGEEIAGPFIPRSPQSDPDLKPLPYDPEGAKKLLASAGWKTGSDGVLERDGVRFEFDLMMGAGSPTMDRLANYVKNQFESAGIRMRITPWEFAVMQTRLDDRNFDAMTMSWMMSDSAEDDPYQVFDSASIANKGSNSISFENKESDALLEEARKTLDDDKRKALWHKWEDLIAEEQPYTFMWARPDRIFINGRFKNTKPYQLKMLPYDWYVPSALQKYK